MDEFLHVWNKVYGTGKFLPNPLSARHSSLRAGALVRGGTHRLTPSDNDLYHALEMLNFFSGSRMIPGFVRKIPKNEIDNYIFTNTVRYLEGYYQ